MINTILEIVLVGLTLVDRADREKISKKILELRSQHAEELSHPMRPVEIGEVFNENSRPIDNAELYSIERELRDILQLYRAAVQAAAAPAQPK